MNTFNKNGCAFKGLVCLNFQSIWDCWKRDFGEHRLVMTCRSLISHSIYAVVVFFLDTLGLIHVQHDLHQLDTVLSQKKLLHFRTSYQRLPSLKKSLKVLSQTSHDANFPFQHKPLKKFQHISSSTGKFSPISSSSSNAPSPAAFGSRWFALSQGFGKEPPSLRRGEGHGRWRQGPTMEAAGQRFRHGVTATARGEERPGKHGEGYKKLDKNTVPVGGCWWHLRSSKENGCNS